LLKIREIFVKLIFCTRTTATMRRLHVHKTQMCKLSGDTNEKSGASTFLDAN